jgi:hypothetical protein
MNLDELVASVTEVELREGLFHWVSEWKNDESDIGLVYLSNGIVQTKNHNHASELSCTPMPNRVAGGL